MYIKHSPLSVEGSEMHLTVEKSLLKKLDEHKEFFKRSPLKAGFCGNQLIKSLL